MGGQCPTELDQPDGDFIRLQTLYNTMTVKLEEGDIVRFVDPHHAMNSDLLKHEEGLGVVRDTERGYSGNKTLVQFLKRRTKSIDERWEVKTERLEKARDGPWEFRCGQCGYEFKASELDRCPNCNSTSITVIN